MMERRSALIVGISSFLMTVAITILLIWKSGLALKIQGKEYMAEMESIGGLLRGAEVRYRGLKVGRIAKIKPNPKDIKVHFRVKKNVPIPVNSKVKVTFDGLIGEKYLLILPNENTEEMAPEGSKFYGRAAVGISDFVEVGTANLEHLKDILNSFRGIFTSEDVKTSLTQAMLSLESITDNLENLSSGLSEIAKDNKLSAIQNQIGSLMDNLNKTSVAMSGITSKFDEQVMNDENINNMRNTFDNLSQLSEQLTKIFNVEGESGSGALKTVSGLTKMKLYPNGYFMYSVPNTQTVTHLDLVMDFKDYFVVTGFGDRSESFKLETLQYGVPISQELSTRIGMFYDKPGIGVNYHMLRNLNLGFDLYDINKFKLDLYSYLLLNDNIAGFFNLRNNTDHKLTDYSVGVKYYFSGFKQ